MITIESVNVTISGWEETKMGFKGVVIVQGKRTTYPGYRYILKKVTLSSTLYVVRSIVWYKVEDHFFIEYYIVGYQLAGPLIKPHRKKYDYNRGLPWH